MCFQGLFLSFAELGFPGQSFLRSDFPDARILAGNSTSIHAQAQFFVFVILLTATQRMIVIIISGKVFPTIISTFINSL